jgi:hypothetical protein
MSSLRPEVPCYGKTCWNVTISLAKELTLNAMVKKPEQVTCTTAYDPDRVYFISYIFHVSNSSRYLE